MATHESKSFVNLHITRNLKRKKNHPKHHKIFAVYRTHWHESECEYLVQIVQHASKRELTCEKKLYVYI